LSSEPGHRSQTYHHGSLALAQRAWQEIRSSEVAVLNSLSRKLRLALLTVVSGVVLISPTLARSAYAKGDDDEDSEDSGTDNSGDDGDGKDSGGDDGDDEEETDKDQPAVTAGGLYNIDTYPVSELKRPLTMTQGILQIRAGLGFDVSAKTAFDSYGHVLDFRYGVKDHVTLLGAFNSSYNFSQYEFGVGLEAALAYDFIDFRTSIRLSREAEKTDPIAMTTTTAKTAGHIDVGFPFRYAAKPEIAIVALDTLMTIDFDSKPDLNPSLGISTNPIPPVSIVIFAQMHVIDFNTDAANFQVPATARVQFSPNQKLDLGAEFRFNNIKPVEGKKFYDDRFLSFYGQLRF
jgi:hypothetical protein